MREYRVQIRYRDGEWHFCTDGRGKYYTYDSEETARRFGPTHANRIWDLETRTSSRDLENFRIVYSDINWQTLDM